MNAHVSIVTRTKDRPVLLARSIRSVLGQTHPNWSHIVVNDGGDSGALRRVIEQFPAAYQERLKLIENPHSLGTTAALNIGMKAAAADYVVTHDDDDSWEPEFLTKTIDALVSAKKLVPQVRGVIAHTTLIEEYVQQNRVVEKYRYSFNGWIKTVGLTRLAGGNFIPPISFLFERPVFSEIGYFNEEITYAEDWEFYLRFLSKFEIAVLPEHLANYHLRSASQGGYGNTVTAGIDNHRVFGNMVRNELIRKDFVSGKFGLGHLVALANAGPVPPNIRHKVWGLQKRLVAQVRSKFRF